MKDLIDSAIKEENNEDHTFFLEGDLSQMSQQKIFLNNRGIYTKQRNVYPCLKEEDVTKALTLICTNKVEGWWNYDKEYLKRGILTQEQILNRYK